MSAIRVLVVEDEILIAETIRIYLEERGHIATEIAISYEEALASFARVRPDVVLLDVRLYGKKSGIDFANYLTQQEIKTPFVFLTSQYDRRIVESAMNTKPMGYLAKPIQKETLWTTVELAHNKVNIQKFPKKKILVNDGHKTHRLIETEIAFIKSDHVYINIVLENGNLVVIRQSLSQMMKQLSEKQFIQCHRGFIINVERVTNYNSSEVEISGEKIPISRSRKGEVLDLIKMSQTK